MAEFDYYEEVRIRVTAATTALGVAGSIGIVGGISSSSHGNIYAVLVRGEAYMIDAADLVPTGRTITREDLYDGTSLKAPAERYTDEVAPPDE